MAPFEIVTADPDADVSSDGWAQRRATDGSFAFYGPATSTIVPIDPGDYADDAWKVMFVGSEPECFLYVFDFPSRLGEPHAYAERVLHSWLRESGRRVGPFISTRQGPVDGWSVDYRWASSSWGEIRAVVGDDRLYEFGCRAGDQRSVEDGRRFTDSFEPTV